MIGVTGALSLPPQMLNLKEKNEQWEHDCMDALESIGRHQYFNAAKLIENYEMVRGKFIFSHYIEREDYSDMLDQLTREFDMPSHLRHYDIISQVINTLSGEYQKRPDLFRVEAYDERAQNAYTRQKSEMLLDYVMQGINQTINQKLIQQGLDPNKQVPPEQQQQYQQQVDQARQALTPPEIEDYMKTNWMDAAEIWAENQLELDKRRFNLKEKEKIEFEDMLVADRCFRHFYLTPEGYNQETWNPIHTFYHKSPEVLHVEDGDYVGRVFFMSIPEVVNRYGHKMTEDQLEDLEHFRKESYKSHTGLDMGELGWAGIPAGQQMPYEGYQYQHFTQAHLGFDPNNPETINYNIEQALGTAVSSAPTNNPYVLFQVTEGYWMSQRKIGKYVYQDPETEQVVTMIVDETAKIPGAKEISNSFMELGNSEQLNTITWTWVNQVYKGLKINNKFVNMSKPIYLDIGPNDFQFKGDHSLYGAKLPVCGQVFNNRNAESMSLVDMMKPHQIGYNVAMNQLYEIMQREVGRFMLMDFNFIPSGKDWGGERNYERLMLIAKSLGIAPIDGSPGNVKGSSFAHFQTVDLDESARMISRLKIAEAFENFALKQVGITPQRLGSVAASESATGVQQAVNQSYAQTESYFTNFSNYKSRCLQMSLDISQYVQSNNGDISMMYIKSDMSRAFIQMSGTDLLLSELGVYVSDSAEAARQLETLKQLFMSSNTTGATPVDLATVIMSNSPNEIKAQLKASYDALQKNQNNQFSQQQQVEQQKIQQAEQDADKQRAFEAQQNDLDRANERYIAEVKAVGEGTIKDGEDQNSDSIPDALEVNKFNAQLGQHNEDMLFKQKQEANKQIESRSKIKAEQDRTKLEQKQLDQQDRHHAAEVELKKKEIESREKIARSKPKPKAK